MTKTINTLRLNAIRRFINLVSLLWILLSAPKTNSRSYNADIYMTVCRGAVVRAILGLYSVTQFFPGIRIWIIDDGTLDTVRRWLIHRSKLNISLISTFEQQCLLKKIQPLPHLYTFANSLWSGKKFILPFLHAKKHKIIMLDSDVLFYRQPRVIARWLSSESVYNLYMKDYKNFSLISPIEAMTILGKKPPFSHVNSGVLCLNNKHLLLKNSLVRLDRITAIIMKILKTRMTYDWGTPLSNIQNIHPILEQTLHWLMLASMKSMALPPKNYIVFPEHKFLRKPITNPVCIHFTGELRDNEPLIWYFMSSLRESLISWIKNKKTSRSPWFLASDKFCSLPNHCIS